MADLNIEVYFIESGPSVLLAHLPDLTKIITSILSQVPSEAYDMGSAKLSLHPYDGQVVLRVGVPAKHAERDTPSIAQVVPLGDRAVCPVCFGDKRQVFPEETRMCCKCGGVGTVSSLDPDLI